MVHSQSAALTAHIPYLDTVVITAYKIKLIEICMATDKWNDNYLFSPIFGLQLFHHQEVDSPPTNNSEITDMYSLIPSITYLSFG